MTASLSPLTVAPRIVTNISCSSCKGSLVAGQAMKVKEMPSRYWMELIDCWSCHQSEFAIVTNKLTFCEDGNLILPSSPNDLLYQGTFAIVQTKHSNESHNTCRGCGQMVGKRLTSSKGEGYETILYFLDKVTFNADDGDTSFSLSSKDLVSLLAQQLLEHIQSHSTCTFKIGSMKIRILSWTMQVAIIDDPSTTLDNHLRPALVLQEAVDPEEEGDWIDLGWPTHQCDLFLEHIRKGFKIAQLLDYPPLTSIIPISS